MIEVINYHQVLSQVWASEPYSSTWSDYVFQFVIYKTWGHMSSQWSPNKPISKTCIGLTFMAYMKLCTALMLMRSREERSDNCQKSLLLGRQDWTKLPLKKKIGRENRKVWLWQPLYDAGRRGANWGSRLRVWEERTKEDVNCELTGLWGYGSTLRFPHAARSFNGDRCRVSLRRL